MEFKLLKHFQTSLIFALLSIKATCLYADELTPKPLPEASSSSESTKQEPVQPQEPLSSSSETSQKETPHSQEQLSSSSETAKKETPQAQEQSSPRIELDAKKEKPVNAIETHIAPFEMPFLDSHGFANQMDAVIAQNGGFSSDPLFPCHPEDKVCFSGLLDLEARYYDHKGNPGFTGVSGDPAFSSFGGVGVRPVFGRSNRVLVGSINNANLFTDLKIPSYARIHSNLAYVNGSVVENSYGWEFAPDWGSVYPTPAALKVDELYLVLANADLLPLYIKIGRMYSDFGHYVPNAYGITTMVPSLTQLMTQSRTGAGQVGLVLTNGLYGSLSVSYAEQSLEIEEHPEIYVVGNGVRPNSRNFSGKLGYKNTIFDVDTHINVSFISDIRDVDYFNDTVKWMNDFFVGFIAPAIIYNYRMIKQGGGAFHADFYHCPFGISFEGAKTFGKMNPTVDNQAFNHNWDSHLYTAGVEGKFDFKLLDHEASAHLGYQLAKHAQIIGSANDFLGIFIHNLLPKYRWQATFLINVVDHINAGLTFVHDHDFDEEHNGADFGSNMVVARLDVEF